jgi:hypothetical protein
MVLGTVMSARKSALTLPLPLQFLAAWLAVWLGRTLQEQVEYLKAENLLPREKLGTKRVMLTDAERRKLATLGKVLGRKGLAAVAAIASPETIYRWYRELVAKKYDGSQQRGHGRPKTAAAEIAALVVRMAKENERWGYKRIMGASTPGGGSIRMVMGGQIEAVGEAEAPLGAGKVGESAWPGRCCASQLRLARELYRQVPKIVLPQ